MRRDIGMQDAARGMCHDDEHGEEAKGGGDHHTAITGHNGLSMITHKGLPALGLHAFPWTALSMWWHRLLHGARRHPQAELQEQLMGDPLLAPRRIVAGHPANQRLQL